MAKPTHKDIVLARLKEKKVIDNVWCFEHHILRLGDIIHRLRKEGYKFKTEMPPDKNCHYYLLEEPKDIEPIQQYAVFNGKKIEIFAPKKEQKKVKETNTLWE